MQNLKILQLCCNLIVYLPKELLKLIYLKKLCFSRNKIVSLPENIGFMINLIEFNISNNNLEYLPSSFSALRRLLYLSLNDNCFVMFPVQVIGCISLVYFFFNKNRVILFPVEMLTIPWTRFFEYKEVIYIKIKSVLKFKNDQLTLREIALRHIIKHAVNLPNYINSRQKEKIKNVNECFLCGGPYFDQYYIIVIEKKIYGRKITFFGKMCINHIKWIQTFHRIKFESYPFTFPTILIRSNYPRVREIFIVSCYNYRMLCKIYVWNHQQGFTQFIPFFALVDGIEDISIAFIRHSYFIYRLLKYRFGIRFYD
ncbi:hypothetical protein COBT_000880 [Conglomerata obtusa]